jgi:hypothetical protein
MQLVTPRAIFRQASSRIKFVWPASFMLVTTAPRHSFLILSTFVFCVLTRGGPPAPRKKEFAILVSQTKLRKTPKLGQIVLW